MSINNVRENSFVKYCQSRKGEIIYLVVLTLLCHGSKLYSGAISIDTEILMSDPEWLYQSWLDIGRPALVLMKAISGTLTYNPYLTGGMTLLFLLLACICFGYFCTRLCSGEQMRLKGLLALMGTVIISHPILTEQLSFDLQSMEIAVGFVIVSIAAYFSVCWAMKDSGYYLCIAVLTALITFLTYQAFIFVYVVMIIQYLFVSYFAGLCTDTEEKQDIKIIVILKNIGLFAGIFLIYEIIVKLWFSESDYLNANNYWVFSTIKENIQRIGNTFINYFKGDSIFHTAYIGILYLLLLLLSVYLLGKTRKIAGGIILVGELLTPFLMVFALGGPPQSYRAELDVVYAEGSIAYGLMMLCCNVRFPSGKRVINRCLIIVSVVVIFIIGWEQMNITTGLYYADQLCYAQDVQFGNQISLEIDKLQEGNRDNYPVYFVGKRRFKKMNSSYFDGETMGKSFFGWVDGPWYHNKRVLGFLSVIGITYRGLSEEEIETLIEANVAKDMPVWPAEGSIQKRDGKIIVKISD